MPKSLVVIGSGAVGVEFASIFKSFGAEVTILEVLPRMVPVEDEDISKELLRLFKKRGIDVHLSVKDTKIEKNKDGVLVHWTDADGKAADQAGGEGAGGRGPRAAHRTMSAWTRRRSRRIAASSSPTNGWRRPSRAFMRSAISLPACRSWRTSAAWPDWWLRRAWRASMPRP